jgi:excisionase family DNA binding protein
MADGEILNADQLAECLRVPGSTLYRLAAEGGVPSHEVGSSVAVPAILERPSVTGLLRRPVAISTTWYHWAPESSGTLSRT